MLGANDPKGLLLKSKLAFKKNTTIFTLKAYRTMDCKLDIGTYKVSWLDEDNKHLLRSAMFPPDKVQEAKDFADSQKTSLTMKLVSEDESGNGYSWELDDAKTWQMDAGRFVFENKIIMVLLAFLLVMGVIFTFKKLTGIVG